MTLLLTKLLRHVISTLCNSSGYSLGLLPWLPWKWHSALHWLATDLVLFQLLTTWKGFIHEYIYSSGVRGTEGYFISRMSRTGNAPTWGEEFSRAHALHISLELAVHAYSISKHVIPFRRCCSWTHWITLPASLSAEWECAWPEAHFRIWRRGA